MNILKLKYNKENKTSTKKSKIKFGPVRVSRFILAFYMSRQFKLSWLQIIR
jgi:hypothetical protein